MTSIRTIAALLAASMLAGTAEAGDPAQGESDFKRCRACHEIVADDGEAVVKGGKTGPNLHGVVGRVVGTVEGYRYGKSFKELAETGLVWDEANLAEYVADPKAWLQEQLGASNVSTKMTFKLKEGGEDMAAYLATFSN